MKVLLTFLHLSSPNLIENDHNFVFFDYKVWTQQHFESRLFWKNAEKLKKHAQLKSYETKKIWWQRIVCTLWLFAHWHTLRSGSIQEFIIRRRRDVDRGDNLNSSSRKTKKVKSRFQDNWNIVEVDQHNNDKVEFTFATGGQTQHCLALALRRSFLRSIFEMPAAALTSFAYIPTY